MAAFDAVGASDAGQRPKEAAIIYATVVEVGFDADMGIFVDVSLHPTNLKETVLLGSPDVDDGGGLVCPYKPGDVVVIAVPPGGFDEGATIIAKCWGSGRRPPSSAQDGAGISNDVVWKVRGTRSLRFITDNTEVLIKGDNNGRVTIETDKGDVTIKSKSAVVVNAPKVLLGENPSAEVATVGSIVHSTLSVAAVAAAIASPTPPTSLQIAGSIIMGATGVEA